MRQDNLLNLITINPKIMGGKPVIHGTRLTIQYILKLMGKKKTNEKVYRTSHQGALL
jgi:uncharacterized protein (DUF433 family)